MSQSRSPKRFLFLLLPALAVVLALGGGLALRQSEGEAKYDEGKRLYSAERYEKAIASWKEAAELLQKEGADPDRAWEKIGTALKELDRPAEAAEWLEKALAADPLDIKRWTKLVSAWREAGEFGKARAIYGKAKADEALAAEMKINPDDARKLEKAYAMIAEAEAELAAANARPTTPSPRPDDNKY